MASEVKTQQQIEDDAFFNMTLAFASEVLPGGEFWDCWAVMKLKLASK